MTDLHTHILPGMDDGSPNTETSIAMLRAERDQGIETVVLTSHFYRSHERPSSFLKRRAAAMDQLQQAIDRLPQKERDSLPRLVLGAEVAWAPHMEDWPEEELNQLCYEGTSYLLLEPTFRTWSDSFLRELYDFHNLTGITPVIAHIDRYYPKQRKQDIEEIFAMGFPVQLSAEELLHMATRGKAMRYLRDGSVDLLISDCHNMTDRAPNIGDAMAVVARKMGEESVKELSRRTDAILLSRK